jgi:hypothetical protein
VCHSTAEPSLAAAAAEVRCETRAIRSLHTHTPARRVAMGSVSAEPKPWQRFAAGAMLPTQASSIRNLKPAPGTASGAALVAVGHPLDTLKVKLQVLAAKHSCSEIPCGIIEK